MSEDQEAPFVPGVDWWVAMYYGPEIKYAQEGLPIAVERTKEEAKRVGIQRVLATASPHGGEIRFRVADGKGESGDAIREMKGHIDETFKQLLSPKSVHIMGPGLKPDDNAIPHVIDNMEPKS